VSFEFSGDLEANLNRLDSSVRAATIKAIESTSEMAVAFAKNNLGDNKSIVFGTLNKSVTRTTAAGGQTLAIHTAVGGETIKAPDTGDNEIAATVGTPYLYGKALENGTCPHMPPVEAIVAWVHQKGIAGSIVNGRRKNTKAVQDADESAAWAIAMSIKKHGTKPKPWLYPGINQADAMFGKFLAQTMREIKSVQ
jgi:hypothetical protein